LFLFIRSSVDPRDFRLAPLSKEANGNVPV